MPSTVRQRNLQLLHFLIKISFLGHIQISQIPDRHEPSDDGTINFTSFFKRLVDIGYDGWVAGEYHAAAAGEGKKIQC